MYPTLERHLEQLVLLPGLAGHEPPVAEYMRDGFAACGLQVQEDVFGNVIAKRPGTDAQAPVLMVFAHMDSLGFFVRYIEPDGFLRLERMGGIPEKALPATPVRVKTRDGKYLDGVIGIKQHHLTPPEEKYVVDKYPKLFVDIGAASRDAVLAAGVVVG